MTLQYSAIRDQLKTGDLLAWRVTKMNSFIDFILYLDQKIFKAEYTHVGMVVKIGERILVVEATPPAVRIYPLSRLDDFYWIKTYSPQHEKDIDMLFSQVGKEYSLLDLIKIKLRLKNSNHDYYCSELASDFYNSNGLICDEFAGLTPDTIVQKICEVCNVKPVFVHIDKSKLTSV